MQLSKQLNSPIQNVVNFALGGNALPRFRDRKNYDFWVAAARCRDPYADWHAVFKPLKLNDPWPDSSQPGKCQWRAYQKEHTRAYGKGKNKHVEHWKTPQLEIDISTRDQPDHLGTNKAFIHHVGEKLSQAFSTDWKRLPCAALNQTNKITYFWSSDINTSWSAAWLAYQWPLCPNGAYILGCKQLDGRIDMNASSEEPGHGYLHALFQPRRPWREAGHLLVCVGLASKDADVRGLALDALIDGIEQGSIDLPLLKQTFCKLSEDGWLKLNRLEDNLLQISRISLLHAWVINQLLQHWITQVDPKLHNIAKMLNVLLETQATIKQTLTKSTTAALQQFTGKNKAGKLASQILALTQNSPDNMHQIKLLTVEYRLNAALMS